jgi:hypothetical protein
LREYLIKAADASGWIPIHQTLLPDVMLPQGWNARQVEGWGDFRMEVDGTVVSMSGEEPGWQLVFEQGDMEPGRADALVEQVRSQIQAASGVAAEVVLVTE